ncbi:hypothetical protein EB796_004489 [Bugula neritina]|uniref:Uncharacterized protein n=1 Tax=Bugula neritina TaxID=10212 RepID=A0A7J7KEY4_BUGNE|nr:hypothetical protein EB796_004489 [Bugula neritina]
MVVIGAAPIECLKAFLTVPRMMREAGTGKENTDQMRAIVGARVVVLAGIKKILRLKAPGTLSRIEIGWHLMAGLYSAVTTFQG